MNSFVGLKGRRGFYNPSAEGWAVVGRSFTSYCFSDVGCAGWEIAKPTNLFVGIEVA